MHIYENKLNISKMEKSDFSITIQGRNKLIVLSMSANEFTEVPHTIGCKLSQGIVC